MRSVLSNILICLIASTFAVAAPGETAAETSADSSSAIQQHCNYSSMAASFVEGSMQVEPNWSSPFEQCQTDRMSLDPGQGCMAEPRFDNSSSAEAFPPMGLVVSGVMTEMTQRPSHSNFADFLGHISQLPSVQVNPRERTCRVRPEMCEGLPALPELAVTMDSIMTLEDSVEPPPVPEDVQVRAWTPRAIGHGFDYSDELLRPPRPQLQVST